jgi:hypothetical protein
MKQATLQISRSLLISQINVSQTLLIYLYFKILCLKGSNFYLKSYSDHHQKTQPPVVPDCTGFRPGTVRAHHPALSYLVEQHAISSAY